MCVCIAYIHIRTLQTAYTLSHSFPRAFSNTHSESFHPDSWVPKSLNITSNAVSKITFLGLTFNGPTSKRNLCETPIVRAKVYSNTRDAIVNGNNMYYVVIREVSWKRDTRKQYIWNFNIVKKKTWNFLK